MSKLWWGLLVGTVLGFLDGASAAFTPAARPILLFIMAASTVKGLITGAAAGWVARRTDSMVRAVVTGLGVGFVLSWLAAATTPDAEGNHHYLEIIVPGAIVGVLAGFASQRAGTPRRASQP